MSQDPQTLSNAIRELIKDRGVEKTVCPSEVARHLAGKDEKQWRLLMKPIRAVAIGMALEGEISIRRKGKIVDPEDFRGVYRLGVPAPNSASNTGNQA